MKSSRPYLLRAIHEWIVDNDCTPFLLVKADAPGVDVPQQFVEDNKIILNISPAATQGLMLGDDAVSFHARFSGKPRAVTVPMEAVLAIYARENGQGMMFADDARAAEEGADGDEDAEAGAESSDGDAGAEDGEEPASRPQRPNLRVIK